MPYRRREDKLRAQRRQYRGNAETRAKALGRKRAYRARNVAILGQLYERHCPELFRLAWRPVSAERLLAEVVGHSCERCRRWRIGVEDRS